MSTNLQGRKFRLKDWPPPPTSEELRFQQYQHSFGQNAFTHNVRLSGRFYNEVQRDRSLKYELHSRINAAKKILNQRLTDQ